MRYSVLIKYKLLNGHHVLEMSQNFWIADNWHLDQCFRWYKDGVEVQVTEKPHISLAGGMLEINSPKEEDAGGYYCAATNIAGTSRSRTRNLYAACTQNLLRKLVDML